MDFTDYQEKAFSTCTDECFSRDYLFLGYLSECGELAGKLAKRIRGDDISDLDIMLEIGDIAWMIAVEAKRRGIDLVINGSEESHFDYIIDYFLCGVESLFCVFDHEVDPLLRFMLLKRVCEGMGFDFLHVLTLNNNKLASRQRRGKIKGNGDNR